MTEGGRPLRAALVVDGARERRRRHNADQVTRVAQRLTHERGLDGFTMEDLAEAAGVSRRTLFNYFAGKDEAVLGVMPPVCPEVMDTFVHGGPTGLLVDDLLEVVIHLVAARGLDRDQIGLEKQVMSDNPHLLGLALGRLDQVLEEALPFIRQREGATSFDIHRARVALSLVATFIHSAMQSFLAEPPNTDQGALGAHLHAHLRHARALLTPQT